MVTLALLAAACGPRAPSPASEPTPGPAASSFPSVDSPPSTPPTPAGCNAPGLAQAALANLRSLRTLNWSPFGRPETGWETYAPRVARELGQTCPPHSTAFARALATWQARHGVSPSGEMTAATFDRMKVSWQMQRPFVRLSASRICPAPPPETTLAQASPRESYGGKRLLARPRALAAYRRMVAAARAEEPTIAADPRNLTIFSAYRSPDYDAARCARDGNCDGVARATCSPHRTGLAFDLYVGQAPGFGPDSTAEPNRLRQSQTPTYRWLVAHAERFGFVNYPFEPWHWEWVGEAP
ncbi:MAG: D-alanyl-D-alanine carboxypeptidase family protein [Phenylobacterium sp.]|uniref:D-alanyl-D-alanine carboxypeptidase family protein n=1 Tax=Phenylobacterium sp. TaxID=1871053 RepID=UPI002733819D|nr:D-alanyl-D-alanine carboxypeptidase family protein [Phenylobacterium sp.]MDP3174062.1 D-alanyl-D-alanine carboxypeptidase family protein [Phenylobacterium sp.]